MHSEAGCLGIESRGATTTKYLDSFIKVDEGKVDIFFGGEGGGILILIVARDGRKRGGFRTDLIYAIYL